MGRRIMGDNEIRTPFYGRNKKKPFISALREKLSGASEAAIHISKTSYIAFIVIGIWFIVAYVMKEGAPMPSPDASLAVFLAIFAAFGLISLVSSAALVALPAYARSLASDSMREALPYLFQTQLPVKFWCALGQYVVVLSPFIILSSGISLDFILYTPGEEAGVRWDIFFAILGGDIVLLLLWLLTETQRPGDAILCALLLNCSAVVWICVLWITFIEIAKDIFSDMGEGDLYVLRLVVFGFLGAYILFHFFLNVRFLKGKAVVAPMLLVSFFFLVFLPGPSFFGAMSLRLLGYGGRIPVHLTERASSGAVLFDDDVCLILKTSKDVMYLKSKGECGGFFKGHQGAGRLRVTATSNISEIHPFVQKAEPSK